MMVNNNLSSINNAMFSMLSQGSMAMLNNRFNRAMPPLPHNMGMQGPSQQNLGNAQFMTDIRQSASALSASLRELSGSAFSARAITSSNEDVLSVSFSGNRPGSVDPMEVIVDQVARGQVNEGEAMNVNARFDGQQGRNTIAIEIGGRTTEISINIAQGETNRIAQRRMADAINNANLGVRATVETDTQTNQSVLRVEATTTGTDARHSFTITDVTGDFAERTGIDQMTSAGQEAIFSVNGELRTSQTNTVNLGQGVTATLRQASDEVIRIAPGQDRNAAKSAINDMVRSFNNLFSAAAENTNDPRAQDLATRLLNTVRSYSRGLTEIGINFDSSGRMRIDNERMDQAMESGRLEQFFTQNAGMNFGFTNQLERLADNVSRNPGNFATNQMTGGGHTGGFGNFGLGNQMHFGSISAGMLFDFMF